MAKRPAAQLEKSDSELDELFLRRQKNQKVMKKIGRSGGEENGNSPRERVVSQFPDSGEEDDEASDIEDSSDEDESFGPDPASDDIPIGQLVAIKQDGRTTAAAMKSRAQSLKRKGTGASFKRDHKHRPSEMSSKKPVPILRDTMQAGTRRGRDPRFDGLTAGNFVDSKFKNRYSFIYDEKLPEEKRELQEVVKRTKNATKKAELQARLSQITQQIKTEQSRRRRAAVEEDAKAKERVAVSDGKRPFYLKKSEKRKQELMAKYEELKSTGQLEKYMEKRRKRNAAKDHRYIPARRPDNTGGD